MFHPRTGYPATERQSSENFLGLWKEAAWPAILERGAGERHEVVDVGPAGAGDGSDEVERLTLIVVGLKRQAEYEIDDRSEPVLPAEVDGPDDVLHGVPPAQVAEHPVTAGLGAEVQAGVCAVVEYEVDGLLRYELWPDLSRECAEVDPAVEASEEPLDPVEPDMDPIGAVGEGVWGDEPDIAEPRSIPADLVDRAVAHVPAEEARRLAVTASKRASPADLDEPLHV